MPPSPQTVAQHLSRLRRRAARLYLLRATASALGGAALIFALGALVAGPLTSGALAALPWVASVATLVALAFHMGRGYLALRGSGAANLLRETRPELCSAAQSAYELADASPAGASDALVSAHRAQVVHTLGSLQPKLVVPFAALDKKVLGAAALTLSLAVSLLMTERGAAGAYSLTHPGETNDAGVRVAIVFSEVQVRVVYPAYLAQPSVTLSAPQRLEVPKGTRVELRARPRTNASSVILSLGDREVALHAGEDGLFFGEWVARQSAPMRLRLQQADSSWVEDAVTRHLTVLEDAAPEAHFVDPSEDLSLDRAESLTLRYRVQDDVGVRVVDLLVRDPQGQENRIRLQTFDSPGLKEATGSTPLDLSLMGLIAGQEVVVQLEVHDGDLVSGPKVSLSRQLRITLASEATRRGEDLQYLEALFEGALDLLAQRLETPIGDASDDQRRRYTNLSIPSGRWADSMRGHAFRLRESASGSDRRRHIDDAGLLEAMASRLTRLINRERSLTRGADTNVGKVQEADDSTISELEDTTLRLDELLGRARVQDAAGIARELDSLRQQIRSLIGELRRAESPEARRDLMAAIGRARQRLSELAQRIAEMGTSIPQEFMNSSAQASAASESVLAQLQEAVERGDLSEAERLTQSLQREIDQLARALGNTEESYVEARFGPRQRAMAHARETLEALEREQGILSERASERRGRAARDALESQGDGANAQSERLAAQVGHIRQTLEEISRSDLAAFEQEHRDSARQRLTDAQDALATGDLGEARRMAERASEDLDTLSRDLDLSALMFPGPEGSMVRNSRSARRAGRALEQFRQDLDSALPDISDHLTSEDRAQMREDRSRQERAADASEGLADTFGGEEGQEPLSEDTARGIREAVDAMQEAMRSMEAGNATDSSRTQEDAAHRLRELREALEEQQESSGGGGGGGGGGNGGDGSGTRDPQAPVVIPGADQFEVPMETRRRILDSMRSSAPRGYESSVRRYLEGLLR